MGAQVYVVMSKHWKGTTKSGKPIISEACGGALMEHKGPQGFTCYNCDKEFPPGTLAEMISVPDGNGGEKWTWLSVNCYEIPPKVYVDGQTNMGPDGKLVDRVLEPDEK